MVAQKANSQSNGTCGDNWRDRSANSLSKLFEQHGLQKVHPGRIPPGAEKLSWTNPTAAPVSRWRSFAVISTSLEKANGGHEGVDVGGREGAEIFAAAAGTIAYTLSQCRVGDKWCGNGWGNHIVIDHGNGIFTRYAHLSKVPLSVGERVDVGTVIGKLGNTGLSDGPHLHFELGYRQKSFEGACTPEPFKSDMRSAEYGVEGVYDPKKLPFSAPVSKVKSAGGKSTDGIVDNEESADSGETGEQDFGDNR
jgi:murein DD-endopeptidase MepM/ murein hydrolase activator NlpD